MRPTRLSAFILSLILLTGCGRQATAPEPAPAGAQPPGQAADASAGPEPSTTPTGTPSEGTAPAPGPDGAAVQYSIERIRAAAALGRPVRELDLNGDGAVEGIIGALGEWHAEEVILVDSGGYPLLILNESLPPSIQGRVDLVSVPGLSDAVLVRQAGTPGEWHSIEFTWMEDGHFVSPWGWHPKTNLAFGQGYAIAPDGTVEITGTLAGHTFVRRYRIKRAPADPFWPYLAELQSEEVTPGPYPATAEDLLTALFIARWYGLDEQIEQYLPDPDVRAAFLAQDVGKVRYYPIPVRVGRLVQGEYGPAIEPAPPDEEGYVEFIATVGGYECGSYWTGRARIGTAADGRMVVTDLEILEHGWSC